MNRRVLAAIKLAVAAAIVVFLATTGRLSLAPLAQIVASPATLAALVALQIVMLACGVLRWWLLLRSIEGRTRSFADLFVCNWIGLFFGCVAPSAVATDVVRYRHLRAASTTTATLSSLVVDRLVGVASIMLLALVCARELVFDVYRPAHAAAIGAGLGALVLGALVVAVRLRVRVGLAPTAGALVLGVLGHLCKVASLWLIVRVAAPGVDVATVLVIAPLGFLVEALPLAPGGMGTAHLAFDQLFALRGFEGGAALFTVYFLVRLLVNLFGGVLWLTRDGAATAPRSSAIAVVPSPAPDASPP